VKGGKFKKSNSKLQKSSKPQTSSKVKAHIVWILNIEYFMKFAVWNLKFPLVGPRISRINAN